MLRSVRTMSTALLRAAARPWTPSPASITVYPAFDRVIFTICRMLAESSTVRMVFPISGLLAEPELLTGDGRVLRGADKAGLPQSFEQSSVRRVRERQCTARGRGVAARCENKLNEAQIDLARGRAVDPHVSVSTDGGEHVGMDLSNGAYRQGAREHQTFRHAVSRLVRRERHLKAPTPDLIDRSCRRHRRSNHYFEMQLRSAAGQPAGGVLNIDYGRDGLFVYLRLVGVRILTMCSAYE